MNKVVFVCDREVSDLCPETGKLLLGLGAGKDGNAASSAGCSRQRNNGYSAGLGGSAAGDVAAVVAAAGGVAAATAAAGIAGSSKYADGEGEAQDDHENERNDTLHMLALLI